MQITHKPSYDKQQWKTICSMDALVENSGVGAIIPAKNMQKELATQVAIFYVPDTDPSVYAIGNYDPIAHANVLCRGIVGSIGEEIVVASPIFKQHFNLVNGQCLEQDICVDTYQIRVYENMVQLLV